MIKILEVVHMIESALLEIIYLLLFGLVAETICIFALIILNKKVQLFGFSTQSTDVSFFYL